jgi:hypothetical protein
MTTARTDDRPGLPARLPVKIILILNGAEFVLPAYPPLTRPAPRLAPENLPGYPARLSRPGLICPHGLFRAL